MMTKRRSRGKSAPRYLLHKPTGQARVLVNGKHIYLAKYDTPESREKYRRVIAEQWNPDVPGFNVETLKKCELTITALAVTYAKYARSYYPDNCFSIFRDHLSSFGRM